MSRLVAVTAIAASVFMLTCSAVGQSQTRRQRQILLQREWQQLIQQMQQENAKLGEQQAAFGEEGLKQTEDAIKELVQILKISNPSENAPDLKDWLDFAQKLGELEHWYEDTLDGIAQSASNSAAIEARLGTLNQRLREDEVAIKTRVDDLRAIDRAIRNTRTQLHPLPLPQPDWTQLDQAIENMRKEDQSYAVSTKAGPDAAVTENDYDAQLKALVAREKADSDAMLRCNQTLWQCTAGCTGPSLSCNKACNSAADNCMAPLQADFDAAMHAYWEVVAKRDAQKSAQ